MKYLFLEQRAPRGVEENEVTLRVPGRAKGHGVRGSPTAAPGARRSTCRPMPCLPVTSSTREPWQLFEEFTALMTRQDPTFDSRLAQANEKLGAGFIDNLTAAMGTEGAFALNGFSVNGPTWVMAALANDPTVIDSSLRKLVETFNAELAPEEQDKRIVFGQESAGGRVWSTMKPASFPFGVTWTYDGGYLVAASDRGPRSVPSPPGTAARPLVWSPAFQGQLPSSAGMHPSAFAWLNTKGALGILSALAPNPALTKLLAERDPVLVVFDGTAEQIHAASRTRLSGLIMDVMLLESAEPGAAALEHAYRSSNSTT